MKDLTNEVRSNLVISARKNPKSVFHFSSEVGGEQFISVGISKGIGYESDFYSIDAGKTFYQLNEIVAFGDTDRHRAFYNAPQLTKSVDIQRKQSVMTLRDEGRVIQMRQIEPNINGAIFWSLPMGVRTPEYLFKFKDKDEYIFVDGDKYREYEMLRVFIGKKSNLTEWKIIRFKRFKDGGRTIMSIESQDGVKATIDSSAIFVIDGEWDCQD